MVTALLQPKQGSRNRDRHVKRRTMFSAAIILLFTSDPAELWYRCVYLSELNSDSGEISPTGSTTQNNKTEITYKSTTTELLYY